MSFDNNYYTIYSALYYNNVYVWYSKIWKRGDNISKTELTKELEPETLKEETKNKNGGLSIQFPVFQYARFDKSDESYN